MLIFKAKSRSLVRNTEELNLANIQQAIEGYVENVQDSFLNSKKIYIFVNEEGLRLNLPPGLEFKYRDTIVPTVGNAVFFSIDKYGNECDLNSKQVKTVEIYLSGQVASD